MRARVIRFHTLTRTHTHTRGGAEIVSDRKGTHAHDDMPQI